MRNKQTFALRALVAALLASSSLVLPGLAAQANPLRVTPDSRVQDLGVAPASDTKTVTLVLKVANQPALDTLLAGQVNPANANYRKFLTPAQFAAQFGQSPQAVSQTVAWLQSQGLTVVQVHPNNLLLTVRGTNAQLATAFGTSIHSYAFLGTSYQAPATKPVMPSALAGVVASVTGMSTRPLMQSNLAKVPSTGPAAAEAGVGPKVVPTPGAPATGTPEWYTTSDLANIYNINPLYQHGLTGAGKTIGIATLAGYNQADAYAYWAAQGLAVDTSRITDVSVDGGYSSGDGPGSGGSGETTLDVEQSGGVAPGAAMRIYIAPNTDSGFIDLFSAAVNENKVDVLSVSWGSIEIGYDPATLNAYHLVFEQAAAQGIPVIAASGDAGAYDINRSPGPYSYPNNCTTLLSVDYPAADPYVLAAGGTTLPGVSQHAHGTVQVPAERPWAWDYLRDYIVQWYGQSTYYASYFPVGGGGGVSVQFAQPSFQTGLSGTMASASAQSLFCSPAVTGTNSWQDWADMPAGFAGRNVPDVALDADPYTGFTVYQGGWGYGGGGTSFVAPQLNGILTLISQGVNGRLGWVAPQLYSAFHTSGYAAGSPFRAVQTGDNMFYNAGAHYNPASGLGSLDVANLAKAFGALPQ